MFSFPKSLSVCLLNRHSHRLPPVLQAAFSEKTGCMEKGHPGQYRTKIVRQMRRQIFRQMKQKAE
jgi:hypothetical protein